MILRKWDEIGTVKFIAQQECSNDVYDLNKHSGWTLSDFYGMKLKVNAVKPITERRRS